MNTVTATIDISRPAGRRIVRELAKKQSVKLTFDSPGVSGIWHDLNDVIEGSFDKLSAHYGVDMRELAKKESNFPTNE